MMRNLIPLLLIGMVLVGCESINQNQQEFNVWIKSAKKPVITKWQNKLRGVMDNDDVLLIDANNNVLFLRGCDMALPDTIK